jgi:hypothetical protein
MRIILLLLIMFFTSCTKENCDISYYPSPPKLDPYHAEYGDNYVKYIFVCVNGYNEVYNYYISGDCWELDYSQDYNFNCS